MMDAYFRIPLFILRFGGIPIKLQSVSVFNRIYIEVLTLCFYVTIAAITMDFIYIIEDIQESMKNVRLMSASVVDVWLHLYLR